MGNLASPHPLLLLPLLALLLALASGCRGGDDSAEPCFLDECNLDCLADGFPGGICNEDDECECVGDDSGPCTPGMSQSCMCPGGEIGTQLCSSDGVRWETCNCPTG